MLGSAEPRDASVLENRKHMTRGIAVPSCVGLFYETHCK
jgi:hypothetical protein